MCIIVVFVMISRKNPYNDVCTEGESVEKMATGQIIKIFISITRKSIVGKKLIFSARTLAI